MGIQGDSFCCGEFNVDLIVEGELCDTRGGDTFQDVYICKKCERVYVVEYGVRTYGTMQCEELYGSDRDEYLRGVD